MHVLVPNRIWSWVRCLLNGVADCTGRKLPDSDRAIIVIQSLQQVNTLSRGVCSRPVLPLHTQFARILEGAPCSMRSATVFETNRGFKKPEKRVGAGSSPRVIVCVDFQAVACRM